MKIEFHCYQHDSDSDAALRRIEDLIHNLERKIMASLDDLVQAANDESTVDDSIIALLTTIKSQLDAITSGQLPPDAQAKIDDIFTKLQSNKQKVADAVTANTPAENTGGATPTPSAP